MTSVDNVRDKGRRHLEGRPRAPHRCGILETLCGAEALGTTAALSLSGWPPLPTAPAPGLARALPPPPLAGRCSLAIIGSAPPTSPLAGLLVQALGRGDSQRPRNKPVWLSTTPSPPRSGAANAAGRARCRTRVPPVHTSLLSTPSARRLTCTHARTPGRLRGPAPASPTGAARDLPGQLEPVTATPPAAGLTRQIYLVQEPTQQTITMVCGAHAPQGCQRDVLGSIGRT